MGLLVSIRETADRLCISEDGRGGNMMEEMKWNGVTYAGRRDSLVKKDHIFM